MAWADILGQPFAVRILQAHVTRDCVPPAYLLIGPEGVGKSLVADEFAKALNCERRPDGPCDACPSCRRIARGAHPDVHHIEPDGATLGIEPVRALLARLALRPYMGRMQVAIIDAADRLTEEAANSLLKTLEEPATWTRFVLITSQLTHCLPTIVSRCQQVRFQRLTAATVEQLLVARDVCKADIAKTVAPLAQGSLAIAAQLAAQWQRYADMLDQFAVDQSAPWLAWKHPADRQGLTPWLACAMAWLRDVAVTAVGHAPQIQRPEAVAAIRRHASTLDLDRCLDTGMRVAALHESLEQSSSARLVATMLREHWLNLLEGRAA